MKKKNNVFKEIAQGLVLTVVGFVLLEALLRIAYFGRNWMVTQIPVTYMFGDDHGPIPPWLDGLRILEPDTVLIWKNRPNIQQRYIDFFSPAHSEKEKTAILRRFLPQSRDSLKGNPTWEISLNSEGFRDVEMRKQKPSSVFRAICLGDGVWLERWFDSELSCAVAGFASAGVSGSKFRAIQFRRGRLFVVSWVEAAKDKSARSQS